MGFFKAFLDSVSSGVKHLFVKRMTLRYPEQKLDLPGDGFKYDPKAGVGIAGNKGRHILYLDKCTGCQLCAIACDGVAIAIEMVEKDSIKYPQNKKSLWPQIDFGRCVFCALCVDACPFDALYMTNEYELSNYDRKSLLFTPEQLAVPPPQRGNVTLKIDEKKGAYHG